MKIVFWKYNESSHRFTFSSVLFCYTCIHAFQARVVEYYVSYNNYTLQPQDNIIYNMNRYQKPGLGSSTVDQVLKYTKYPKYIPSTSTGQVLMFLKST